MTLPKPAGLERPSLVTTLIGTGPAEYFPLTLSRESLGRQSHLFFLAAECRMLNLSSSRRTPIALALDPRVYPHKTVNSSGVQIGELLDGCYNNGRLCQPLSPDRTCGLVFQEPNGNAACPLDFRLRLSL